jgi:hypothetical protein
VGVIVEGPSDQTFWSKLLWRCLPGINWDVRALHGRSKVLRNAAPLAEVFRSAGARAVVVLLDQDDDPCVTAVRELFPEPLRIAFASTEPRHTQLFVAIKELESWFLADEDAIRLVTGCQSYSAPAETARGATKSRLRELLRSEGSSSRAFNEIGFAKQIASAFSPERARNCSQSFAYCWSRFEAVAAENQKSVP